MDFIKLNYSYNCFTNQQHIGGTDNKDLGLKLVQRHLHQNLNHQFKYLMKNQRRSSKLTPIESTSRHELRPIQHSELLERTSLSLSNIRLKFLLSEMAKKIKFLSPPFHKPDKVGEQWQGNCDNKQINQLNRSQMFGKQTLTQELSNRYIFIKQLQIVEGLFILCFCWIVSVSFVFRVKFAEELSFIIAALTLIKLGVKVKIMHQDSAKQEAQLTYQVEYFQDFILPIILLTAAVMMTIRAYLDLGIIQIFFGIFQLFCVFMHWRRIGKYFSYLTQYAEHNKMRKQLRIIELFCFTLAMAHIFSLIMYSMIYISPQGSENWIQKAQLQGKPWYVLYVYSYYWANTTMVTVGYGDLTPSNYVQAIVVTLIQIVGTAIFGYMINVIGITVNQIQKKNLQFQEYQATILKMKEHYKLTRQLCYKMKNDIRKKQSESKEAPLKNNQERQFLDYIDSSLKEEFVLQTNMKVIKKSIFFLTHFTVNFQNEIALKLIRCIYKPEQTLSIEQNGQRQLVIVNNGIVNIFYYHNFHNSQKSKLSRQIKSQQGKPTLNVFGFSSLILNRNINLKAITKQTTTAYILKRKDVLQSISKSVLDFQSFNQLREKMLTMKRLEEVQAPSIKDIERHYMPNTYLLLKKVKHTKQERLKCSRSNRKMAKKVITFKSYQNKTLLLIPHNNNRQQIESHQFLDLQDKGIKPQFNDKNMKEIIIDQSKIFQNFMKNYNLNVIAVQYEKSCMKKSYNKRNRAISRTTTKKLIKEL